MHLARRSGLAVAAAVVGAAVVLAVEIQLARAGTLDVDIAGPTGPPFRRHPDRYFAADDFHPSDAGYGLWADAVLKVLRSFR